MSGEGRGLACFSEIHLVHYCFKKRQNTNWNVSILVVVLKRYIFRHLGFSHHVPTLFELFEKKNSVIAAATGVEEHRRGHFGFYHRVTLEHIFHYRLSSA